MRPRRFEPTRRIVPQCVAVPMLWIAVLLSWLAGCSGAGDLAVVTEMSRDVPVGGGPGDRKRGVAFHFCGWRYAQGEADLKAMVPGISWYYNWSSRPLTCADGKGVGNSPLLTGGEIEFVPMAWGLIDEGRACETDGPCFRVDERSGGDACREICAASRWSFDPDGACYACSHEGISRAAFLQDVPARAKYLLGYNEPNFKEQANLTPEVAARGWRHLEWVAHRRDLLLVGPSTNFCDPTPGARHPGACIEAVDGDRMLGFAWLERFYDACSDNGAAQHACRIDHQSVHAYSCGGISWMITLMKGKAGLIVPAAAHCHNGVRDEDEFGTDCGGNICTACSPHARAMFRKPVWLTEFATPKEDCRVDDPTALTERTLEFMASELPKLHRDPFVFRYAWFMPKVSRPDLDHADLLVEEEAGVLSTLGRFYLGRLTPSP